MALIGSAAGLAIIAAWPSVAGLVLGTIVFAGGMSLMYPAMLTLALTDIDDSQRGSVVGTVSTFFDLSSGLGALILGGAAAVDERPGRLPRGDGAVPRRTRTALGRDRPPGPTRAGRGARLRRDAASPGDPVARRALVPLPPPSAPRSSLLVVTNDFPPKFGGIQSYLYELWRRLPPGETTVLTTPHAGAADWDAQQAFRVERIREPVMLPTPGARAADRRARARGRARTSIFLDPALPLGRARPAPRRGAVGGGAARRRDHGARPAAGDPRQARSACCAARPVSSRPVATRHAKATRAAERNLAGVVIPPGVDIDRFTPAAGAEQRRSDRVALGIDPDRATRRRGQPAGAAQGLRHRARRDRAPRDRRAAGRRGRRARPADASNGAARRLGVDDRVRFLGRVSDEQLTAVYRSGDVFAMMCRERWGGLEAEGFGIVFLEAAAQRTARDRGAQRRIARGRARRADRLRGRAGRRHPPGRAPDRAADRRPALRSRMGAAARAWAEECSYDARVGPLVALAGGDLEILAPLPLG